MDKSHAWVIEPGRVGVVELGRPVPAALIDGELEGRYLARRIADGVAQDAFHLDDPPLTLVLADGPFTAADRKGHDTVALEHLRPLALQAARDGVAVASISIHGAGPVTAAGLGLGSTLAELRAAYPDLALAAVPPTEGGDEGVATTASLPGLAFVFASREAAGHGAPVKRVDLWIALP